MSTSAKRSCDPISSRHAETERRKSSRHRAAFRRCCVVVDGIPTQGVMRNFSANGAQIEAHFDATIGQEISYFWEVRSCMRARVVWTDGCSVGLEHLPLKTFGNPSQLPSRDLRIECSATVKCLLAGGSIEARIKNISAQGICLEDLPILGRSSTLVVELCGRALPVAKLRWQNDSSAGLSLAERMTDKELARLLTDRRLRPVSENEGRSQQHP